MHGPDWAEVLIREYPRQQHRAAILDLPRIGMVEPAEFDAALTAWLNQNYELAVTHKYIGAWVSLISQLARGRKQ